LALDQGEHFLVNGIKNWITNGNCASFYLLIAQSNPDLGYKGINAFIVEKEWEGIKLGPKENKMGIRGSDTHSIMFNDVRIPKKNRLGEEGFGFKLAMQILNGGRIGIAAQALGIASGAFELSLKYSRERRSFGLPIFQHQGIQFKLSEMATSIEAARLLTYQAAFLKDSGKSYVKESAMAKLFASQTAMDVTTDAVQIHGGYGYVKDYHVERMMRDAKITQIYEGTSEIQKLVIGRELTRENP
jgi:alkylation response protein AidB-like acyl-CoA dehydrogenase